MHVRAEERRGGKNPIYRQNEQRTNRVSGVGMATGFERVVCRLIDAPAPNPSIGRIHPPLMDGVDAFRFPPPLRARVRLSSNGLAMLEISYGFTYGISIFPAGNSLDFSRTISKDIIGPMLARAVTLERAYVRNSARSLKIAHSEYRARIR